MSERVDIFIAGAGLAGLVAAAAFGRAGFSVVVADPAPPVARAEAEGSDLRSTAYLLPSRDLIAGSGLWDALDPHATPLDILRVIDTVGRPPEIRATRDFRSDEMGDRPFGWNLPNWLARRELSRAIDGIGAVDLRFGTGFKSLLPRETEALVTLADGARLRARLVIAADGRGSQVRDAAGIGAETWRYGQKAMAFAVTHPIPHENVSVEIYNRGGAFTLVPMRDHDGSPASAVVWMNEGRRALELMEMAPARLNAEITERSCGVFGPLELAGDRRLWPVVTQTAAAMAGPRVALIAEAAHVLPPIGAQGLNTSLQDVAALLALARETPGRLGDRAMLDAYEAARAPDVRRRARAIDLFNRVCKSGLPEVQALRLAGLRTVHGIAPLRRAVMRAGLGAAGQTI